MWTLLVPALFALTATPCLADDDTRVPIDRVRYRVVVDAPAEVRETIERSLDLVRWQDFEDMTEDLLDRLIRDSIAQVREAAAAEGYFSAHVDIAVLPAKEGSDGRVTLKVAVEPGAPTTVARANLRVTGPAAEGDAEGAAAIERMNERWPLRAGDVFRQSVWASAKARAVAIIAASPYAAARMERSEAIVDPAAHTVTLGVEIASGPAFRFGAIEVTGLAKYDVALVRNYSTVGVGELYSEPRVEQFIRRLNASGYFASVQAAIEPDPEHSADATMRVGVIEAPPKRLEAGLGYTTDTGIRASFLYSDVNVNDHATQLHVDGRADQKIQSFSVRLVSPPTTGGYLDSFGAQIQRTDIEGLETRTAAVGIKRQTLEERDLTAWSATYFFDRQTAAGTPEASSYATTIELARTWRNVDDLIDPTRGYVVNARLGGGPPVVSTRAFGRAIAKAAAWWPLGQSDSLSVRAEAGAVIASSREDIPSALLFRTGGDTTVRGYAFESLGVQQGDATVGGRYYALASIEATHYFTNEWGLAAFVDAGNANDDLRAFRPVYGYGAGLRAKSPIGPFRLDVAYGQEAHAVRVHLSVGLSF